MTTPSTPPDAYAAIAEWYDIEHDPLTDDLQWLDSYLADLSAETPTGKLHILEVGAGTGRVAAALALAGHEVRGIEPSAAMRERCARRLATLPPQVARRVRVQAGDARHPALAEAERADAIIFSLNTLAHLVTSGERLAALRAAHPHLHSGGRLLLDLDLGGPRRLAATAGRLWHQGTWQLPSSTRLLTHLVSAAPATAADTVKLTHFYDVYEQGGAVQRTVASMTLALLTKAEMLLSLEATGYALEHVYPAYTFDDDDEAASDHLVFIARPQP